MSAPPAAVPRPKRLYLDSSAYLCMLLGEGGCEKLSNETGQATLLSSVILIIESRRSLVRLAREGKLTPERYQACLDRVETDTKGFGLRDVTLDLCESTVLPAVLTPRSLDLVHLRSALWFHIAEPIDRFVTRDSSQERAAKELGLPV